MNNDKNEQPTGNTQAENAGTSNPEDALKDHPGLQNISKNPNPRANENIPDETADTENGNDATEQAGSEITDGEDG